MSESFVAEVESASFGDHRLSKRLVKIFHQLSNKPHLSIPAAIDSDAEMEAAYRFFRNPRVNPQAIMTPHLETTFKRLQQAATVLLVQDTTSLDLTRPERQVDGSGPLRDGPQCGVFYHPLVAFNDEGLALGTIWSKTWAREPSEKSSAERIKIRKAAPIEDKESMRWIEGIRAARATAVACPNTTCVCVADSEADMYEWFAEPRACGDQGELHLLVRACHDRALHESNATLAQTVRAAPCLYEAAVSVSRHAPKIAIDKHRRDQARDARIATVEVRATTVTLRPPHRPDREFAPLRINVVLIHEPHPPQGMEPITWLLLTTLPIAGIEDVKTIVQHYCVRWQIEVYFRTLKSGCRVEDRLFQRTHSLLNCLAVYAIIAWKVLYLCRLSRECPDLPCDVVFTTSEWKAVYVAIHRKMPASTPTLNEMVRMVARLGGFINRKSNNPGTQTLWLGLQRVHDLSTAWQSFGPPENFLSQPTCVVQ